MSFRELLYSLLIMPLYRINNISGDEDKRVNSDATNSLYTYCPFLNGIYSFTYGKSLPLNAQFYPELLTTSNRPSQNLDENIHTLTCGETTQPNSKSLISNCPKGHVIKITFQKESCVPNNYHKVNERSRSLNLNNILEDNVSFDCLGDWPSETIGERYIALLETSDSLNNHPRYRCGVSF